MASLDAPEAQSQIGPYRLRRTDAQLHLVRDNRGEVTLRAALLFGVGMVCILILGVLSVVIGSTPGVLGPSGAERALAPKANHIGWLWAFSCILMALGLPVYVWRSAASSTRFLFDRPTRTVRMNRRLLTKWHRIEWLEISEGRDPEGRFLYTIWLSYGDGLSQPLHHGYEERAAMNLANEIARFLGSDLRWR